MSKLNLKKVRDHLIKVAFNNPDHRSTLMPLIKQAEEEADQEEADQEEEKSDKEAFSFDDPNAIAGRIAGYLDMQVEDLNRMSRGSLDENDLKRHVGAIIKKLEGIHRKL